MYILTLAYKYAIRAIHWWSAVLGRPEATASATVPTTHSTSVENSKSINQSIRLIKAWQNASLRTTGLYGMLNACYIKNVSIIKCYDKMSNDRQASLIGLYVFIQHTAYV